MVTNEAEKARPNPAKGIPAGQAYADAYAAHHRATGNTLEYKTWEVDLLALDALLNNYTLLEVGCATGGYLRLLKNHARVVGIDFSETTIVKARELQTEFNIQRVEFAVSMFETYEADCQFDAVRIRGIYGAYQPWCRGGPAIDKTRALLKDGGVAIASHYLPRNFLHTMKSTLLPNRTLAIPTRRYMAMWTNRGFANLFSIKLPHTMLDFFQKV